MKVNEPLHSAHTIDINFLPQPCYCLDICQRYLAVNDHALRLLSVSLDKQGILGKTPYDIHDKAKADLIVQQHQQVINTGRALQIEESIPHTKNNIRHYKVTIMPGYDNSGNVVRTSAIFNSVAITKIRKQSTTRTSVAGFDIFRQLEEIANVIPVPFYWSGLDYSILGYNSLAYQAVKDCSSLKNIIGKTAYDIYPKEIADGLVNNHRIVVKTNEPLRTKEVIQNRITGRLEYYDATLAPLHDEMGNVIGVYGISIDITAQEEAKANAAKRNIFKQLEDIAEVIPVPFYWLGLDHTLLGYNSFFYQSVKECLTSKDIINKTAYDVYPKEIADKLIKNQETVIKTDKPLRTKEFIKNIITGKSQYYDAILAPLHDESGNTIGIYGLSIDITAQKEAEALRRESEVRQVELEQQTRFKRFISQAVHDIRSPLASLKMLLKTCEFMPEAKRIILDDIVVSINAISESLLDRWMADNQATVYVGVKEKLKPTILYLELLHALAAKRYEYQSGLVTFDLDVESDCYFKCINVQASNFRRVLSNLLNNAVKAYEGSPGKISITLEKLKRNSSQDQMKIVISDQGKGIPPAVLDKIKKRIQVTHGKVDGHGIGLIQVQETLQENKGQFFIESELDKGTTITLIFPSVAPPKWLAQRIEISDNDTLVIVDDDNAIHVAWDNQFQLILRDNPNIQLRHFYDGGKALDFINNFKEKDKLFLLMDYGLGQLYNGLEIIEKTQISRSILVTGHYSDSKLQTQAISSGTKIFPKPLASELEVIIKPSNESLQEIDIVIADNDRNFAHAMRDYMFSNYRVATYYRSEDVLRNASLYSKDTAFLLDYEYPRLGMSGLELGRFLLKKGYSVIFILSGYDALPDQTVIPESITVLCKEDLKNVENTVKQKLKTIQTKSVEK